MNVEIKFFTSLREITGRKVDILQLKTIISIEELFSLLLEKYGKEFGEYVYDKKNKVQDFLSILVNGKNINTLHGLDTELKEGDIVAILPPVGGG
jgi:molybdopterin synthase sulfur carrier subunit